MKKIISIFVIATMIFTAMSFTVSAKNVATLADFGDHTTIASGEYVLTADMTNDDALWIVDSGATVVIDLNGHKITSNSGNGAVRVGNGDVTIKNGTIECTVMDAIDVGNGKLYMKDVTVLGGTGGSDAIFAGGGNITLENCTLSGEKAGIDAANNNEGAGAPAIIKVIGGKFANFAAPGNRCCAIELRNSGTEGPRVTLEGDITFENSRIAIRNDYQQAMQWAIKAGEGSTVAFTAPVFLHDNGSNTWNESTITYTYTAPTPDDDETTGAEDTTVPEDTTAPAPAAEDINVDISAIPGADASNTDLGYDVPFYWMGGDKAKMPVGSIDLSQYESVVVTYGANGDAPVNEHDLKLIDKDGNTIAANKMTVSGHGWGSGKRNVTLTIDSDYNGELFFEKDEPGHAITVSAIKFIAKKSGSSSDLPKENLKINVADLPGADTFGPAGYGDKKVLLINKDSNVSLGNIDLAGYTSVVVSYGGDPGVDFTQDKIVIKDAAGTVLAEKALTQEGVFWAEGQRKVTVSLSGVNYNGEVIISKTGNDQIAIDAITFTAPGANTGDMFIVVIAAVAMIALAGVVVCKKVRV